MSEQITWTHVVRLVRKMHDEEGLLPVGNTDAEIAYNFVKFLINVRTKAEQDYRRASERYYARERELMRLEQRLKAEREKPQSKTKKRLKALEDEVARIRKVVDACPPLPFTIARCANKHCGSQAREISPYCEKCEPDL